MLAESTISRLQITSEFCRISGDHHPIEGFLSDLQGYALMLLAEQGPGSGVIVEIGSFKGKSTAWLARGAKRGNREKVYAVDHFTGSPEHQKGMPIEDKDVAASGSTFEVFSRNIASLGLGDQVIPIIASSAEAASAWEKPIRLLFIDADHSYEASKIDFDSWAPHVVSGGLIAFHDIDEWPGVTEFYRNEVLTNPAYRELLRVDSIGVVEKV